MSGATPGACLITATLLALPRLPPLHAQMVRRQQALTERERAVHLLGRATYGEDVEEVLQVRNAGNPRGSRGI